ncbi:hypothetical protein [uncultured Zoogloea sp.]|uniref:hypothetical protein n=1 Tax=uncultured Zoogloea sp. TaxID=160237 RepID=UPI002609CD02|nr:hypothetical protein [uncultured Zoogloea sp.]
MLEEEEKPGGFFRRASPMKKPTLTDRPISLNPMVPVKGIEPSTFALQVRGGQL